MNYREDFTSLYSITRTDPLFTQNILFSYLICLKKATKSRADWDDLESLVSVGAISSRVFWRNFAYSILATSFCLYLFSLSLVVVKVEGNMPGNNFKATGSKNSMNGTITKTEKGTSLKRSPTVRTSCRFSLLVRVFPFAIFHTIFETIPTSTKSRTNPDL